MTTPPTKRPHSPGPESRQVVPKLDADDRMHMQARFEREGTFDAVMFVQDVIASSGKLEQDVPQFTDDMAKNALLINSDLAAFPLLTDALYERLHPEKTRPACQPPSQWVVDKTTATLLCWIVKNGNVPIKSICDGSIAWNREVDYNELEVQCKCRLSERDKGQDAPLNAPLKMRLSELVRHYICRVEDKNAACTLKIDSAFCDVRKFLGSDASTYLSKDLLKELFPGFSHFESDDFWFESVAHDDDETCPDETFFKTGPLCVLVCWLATRLEPSVRVEMLDEIQWRD